MGKVSYLLNMADIKPTTRKVEIFGYKRKKCKSCKHFYKTECDCRCSYNGYANPMDAACSNYEKRKK